MRVVAVLCTYEESMPLPGVLKELAAAVPGVRALVVDDDSPDGTAHVAKSLGAEVLVRRGRPRGRGWAGREGYVRALELGAEVILEMDADGSHDPKDAPRLITALDHADIAVGSRSAGADERGWPRRLVSAAAKGFLRMTLGLPLSDPTSGYRAFRAEALRAIDPGSLTAEGPEIVEEVYVRAARAGLALVEVPITFRRRVAGESKLTIGKTLRVMVRCLRLFMSKRGRVAERQTRRP